jgi:hypothetical protein
MPLRPQAPPQPACAPGPPDHQGCSSRGAKGDSGSTWSVR